MAFAYPQEAPERGAPGASDRPGQDQAQPDKATTPQPRPQPQEKPEKPTIITDWASI